MKFVDEVTIEVISGKGGDGAIAFRREKFVPMGGPAGGDGGRGGDVIFEATDDLTTLYELSFTRKLKAENGQNGQPKDMIGANGKNLVVKVPVGTLVYDAETGQLLVDLDEKGQQEIIAKGGRGGRGNARFTSSVRRAPRIAEKGEPARELRLRLELKLLADVGLVGLPNAGKSTFLRSVSNARPKVADYPFTTLIPSLGIVKPEGATSFCMADIPGLIEGAHQGTGLGIQFLKHVERTRLLLHLVDTSQLDLEDVVKNYDVIMAELKAFSEELGNKPVIVAANKMDLPDSRELFPLFNEEMQKRGIKVFPVSGATREGVDDLLKYISSELKNIQVSKTIQANEEEKVYEYLAPFEIEETSEGYFTVVGAEIERLVAMTDFTNDEAIALFKRKLKKMGFIDELASMAADDEDVFAIGEMEFEYREFFD
ncbi:MAG: GTPase [Clostridiales bacterium]|jgi:GTP-binding protein|nr:GTPase [Clostridiales bacterium]MDN5282382.1 GTPase [Candidatus Ozemobacter sp.]